MSTGINLSSTLGFKRTYSFTYSFPTLDLLYTFAFSLPTFMVPESLLFHEIFWRHKQQQVQTVNYTNPAEAYSCLHTVKSSLRATHLRTDPLNMWLCQGSCYYLYKERHVNKSYRNLLCSTTR